MNYYFHMEGFPSEVFDRDAHGEEICDELPATSDDEHMTHQYQQLCMSWLKTQTKPQQRNSGHLGHCLRVQNKHYVFVTRIRFCVEGGGGQTVGKQGRRVWSFLPLDLVSQSLNPQVFFVLKTSSQVSS